VVTVLTVDDHSSFRRAAFALVSATPDFEEVGQASTGEEGVAAAHRLLPDLVLMDVRLPDIDGCEASRRIVAAHPGILVVLISSADEAVLGSDAPSCAAVAVLAKDRLRPGLLREIWEAHRHDG
jgi:two-component system, NarL family, invasion response regulator UvrY